ncbi:MAG TPA: transferrin receptor-like dimerization domain-containing protein [Verrucomicrobiae bacterium]|jgi:N-acetylated-alpha-linked acidic dipeptidase|nr:transferrin receptor-like dimerization domain-containing protein [Verrucomicrobiae bacterium]
MNKSSHRGFTALAVLIISVALDSRAPAADAPPLYGFSPTNSESELQLESTFRAIPDPANLRQYMERLAAHPHHVGSPYQKENAEWIHSQMTAWGWESSIEQFDVLFPTPKTRILEMTEPVQYTALLRELPEDVDPTSSQTSEQLPTYNAYSTDGDVTAPLVYVNYGLSDDYKELARLGVSVKGAIVIAKYGQSWRGIKPKVAAEHGAIGCILFSDPKDDGYSVDDVFPNGPMRNTNGVQRGSVMDFPSTSPGDPLTPGYGAVPGAKRLSLKEATAITKIPVLPISSGDALPLLSQLKGPPAPDGWRGALPITYHLGPGPAKVHLKLEFNWDIKPVYDVISRLPGGVASDEWVIRGNHYDAWVNGAYDPISGQVCLLEEARALGRLVQQGWKPRRTIIYCSWDGEEPMLLGSTEWVETHAEELRRHAVAYINSDDTGRGFLNLEGSHILENLINNVAHDIADPEVNMNIWKRVQASRIAGAGSPAERREIRDHGDLQLDALGSGSDYTGFLDFVGVPSLNVEFHGESHEEGVYHSIYDDFYWYTHFADTNFGFGKALSQTIGDTVLRLADAEVIPYEFNDLSGTVAKYAEDLQNVLKHKQEEIEERNLEIEDGVFAAISDPQHPKGPPEVEATPPEINFAPLENSVKTLTAAGKRFQKADAAAQAKFGDSANAAVVAELNGILLQAERSFLDPAGLPRRPWYKHLLYAPGVYAGYGSKTLPGVREGIEMGRYDEAEKEIVRVAKALDTESKLLDSATKVLDRIKP